MPTPGEVPSLQYYKDFNTPLTAVTIHQLLKDDYKSRRPRRCLTNVFRLLGFVCLMSGICYIIVNQHLQSPPANTLPTACPSPKVPTACPTTTTAGLTGTPVVKLITSLGFDKVKAYDGALYLVREQQATFDDAKVNVL